MAIDADTDQTAPFGLHCLLGHIDLSYHFQKKYCILYRGPRFYLIMIVIVISIQFKSIYLVMYIYMLQPM